VATEHARKAEEESSREWVLSELRGLAQARFTKHYPRGSVIFSEGEKPRGVYVLCEGRVKISITSAEGKTLILEVSQPGELLGIDAIISGQPYGATAKTVDKCRLNFFPSEQFLRLINKDHRVYAAVVQALSLKLSQVVEHTRLLFLSKSASEKLARLLVRWCDELGTDTPQGIRIDSRLTHEEVAQMICSSRETVTRLLSEFKQKGILSLAKNGVFIRDREALEALTKVKQLDL
jgi:CRP/FNR family cyclic AMP-dependent transcriptional regulator